MNRLLVTLLIYLGLTLPSGADELSLPVEKDIDLLTLTREMKAVVPALEGLAQDGSQVQIRSLGGQTFTKAEQKRLTDVLEAHTKPDPKDAEDREIPLSDILAGGGAIAGAASLVVVARRKKGS